MPISDLLAQISGGKGGDIASRPVTTANNLKRKANSDLQINSAKKLRLEPSPSKPQQASRPSHDKPSSTSANGTSQRYNGTAGGRVTASRTAVSKATVKPKPPLPSVSASSNKPGNPLKKSSFAEILARGKAAQVTMGQVGKIQHKKVDASLKLSKENAVQDVSIKATGGIPRGKKPVAPSGYGGTSRQGQQRPADGISASRRPGAKSAISSSSSSRKRFSGSTVGRNTTPTEPEKKIKKAATATTGYSGTARPRPGTDSSKSNGKRRDIPRGGALLSRPGSGRSRRGGSGKYDEYDEDLDDFIDYDEDEEEDGQDIGGGQRFHYASDASSDMEAGIDDIDDEEDRAARIARQEDIREERLEKTLKAAKEERRRKSMGYR